MQERPCLGFDIALSILPKFHPLIISYPKSNLCVKCLLPFLNFLPQCHPIPSLTSFEHHAPSSSPCFSITTLFPSDSFLIANLQHDLPRRALLRICKLLIPKSHSYLKKLLSNSLDAVFSQALPSPYPQRKSLWFFSSLELTFLSRENADILNQ